MDNKRKRGYSTPKVKHPLRLLPENYEADAVALGKERVDLLFYKHICNFVRPSRGRGNYPGTPALFLTNYPELWTQSLYPCFRFFPT